MNAVMPTSKIDPELILPYSYKFYSYSDSIIYFRYPDGRTLRAVKYRLIKEKIIKILKQIAEQDKEIE